MTSQHTVRLGIVGLRNIGMKHLKGALPLDGVSITALADTDDQRLAEARKLAPDAQTFTDASELLASDAADAVVLAVPNHLHAPMTVEALDAGKHVLVEKPMAMNTGEARRMIDARDRSGQTLLVGMNQRFAPLHAAARRAVSECVLGEVTHGLTCWVTNRPFAGLWERGDWFLSGKTSGGGPLIDLGIHRLDLAMYLLDFPAVESVTGFCTDGIGRRIASERGLSYELEDYAQGLIRFDSGMALTLEAGYFQNVPAHRQETILSGADASLVLEVGNDDDTGIWAYEGDQVVHRMLEPDTSGPASPVEHFCRVLRGEDEPGPTAEQGLAGLTIVEAIYESARTGRAVTF